jgi:hypothetical protein
MAQAPVFPPRPGRQFRSETLGPSWRGRPARAGLTRGGAPLTYCTVHAESLPEPVVSHTPMFVCAAHFAARAGALWMYRVQRDACPAPESGCARP